MPRSPTCVSWSVAFLSVALIFPCAAQAAVVQVHVFSETSMANLVVTALPGEANQLSLQRRGDGVVAVRDDGAPLYPGERCRGGGLEVTCSVLSAPEALSVNISASDGDDRLALDGLGSYASSVLSAGRGDDVVLGGAADDALDGNAGNDRLLGGGGADRLSGWQGADVMRGGAGDDMASYESYDASVTVTLDDRADDGAAGEGDDVGSDVENVIGGRGPDRLRGSAGPNMLEGGEGGDDLDGGAGDDTLIETEGRLMGGPGRDNLQSGFNSLVDVRDGEADTVQCGVLARPLEADAVDRLAGCVPPASIRGAKARVTRSGRVGLRFRCDAIDQPCLLRLDLRYQGRKLAHAALELDAGRQRASVRLNAHGRRLLRRNARLRVTSRVQLYRTNPAPSVGERYRGRITLERRP